MVIKKMKQKETSIINSSNAAELDNAIRRMRENDKTFTKVHFKNLSSNSCHKIADALKSNRTIIDLSIDADALIGQVGVDSFDSINVEFRSSFFFKPLADALSINNTLRKFCMDTQIDCVRIIIAKGVAESTSLSDVALFEIDYTNVRSSLAFIEVVKILELKENMNITNLPSVSNSSSINYKSVLVYIPYIQKNITFLADAVSDFTKSLPLTEKQHQTLLAHYHSQYPEINKIFPMSVRRQFAKQRSVFSEALDTTSQSISRNIASNVSDFIPRVEVVNFNQAASKIKLIAGSATPATKYFRGLVPITPEIESGFTQLQRNAEGFDIRLREAMQLRNNVVLIADGLKNAISFEHMIGNLRKIAADPATQDFALNNPKKLGYLLCLSEDKLDQFMHKINNSVVSEGIKATPEEIAKVDGRVSPSILETMSYLAESYGGFAEAIVSERARSSAASQQL